MNRPVFISMLVLGLSPSSLSLAQEGQLPLISEPASATSAEAAASPFGEDQDLVAQARAQEEARIKAAKEEAAAAELKAETRRVSIQTALAPIKVLARGLQGERAVVLIALDGNRRIMIAKNERMTLNTTTGTVELLLKDVTRQTLSFELNDGTILPLQ